MIIRFIPCIKISRFVPSSLSGSRQQISRVANNSVTVNYDAKLKLVVALIFVTVIRWLLDFLFLLILVVVVVFYLLKQI